VRSVLLLACLLAGCARDAMPGVPEQQDGVTTKVLPSPTIWRADILLVIDDSPAMRPYTAAVAQSMRDDASALFTLDNFVDVHVGVITADVGDERDTSGTPIPGSCAGWGDAAAFRRSELVDGAFIDFRQNAAGQHSNVTGTIGNALAALTDVGANGCARARPLEAMRIALDHNPHDGGFRRTNAQLAVVLIAAQDDDSPRTLDEYATFLKQLQPNAAVVLSGGLPLTDMCGEQATDRLYAFSQLFGIQTTAQSICSVATTSPFGAALSYTLPGWGVPMASPCFDQLLADVDPTMPGLQPDCSVTEYIDRGRADEQQRLLAHCGTGALPCWRIVEDPQCGTAQHLSIEVDRGGEDPPDNDVVEAQCVSL
jgi:hypothetical protein